MVYIITRGKTNRSLKDKSKDELHRRRKVLSEDLKDGIMSHDKMMWRDLDGSDKDKQVERVEKYDNWKEAKKDKMDEWNKINREFKNRGEEGRIHCLDDIRKSKSVKYD